MSLLSPLTLAVLVTVAQAQSLNVVNKCTEFVFLFTQSSFGAIHNDVQVATSFGANSGVGSNWVGAVDVGTGCQRAGSYTTGGPTWDGVTPFSRAEFNFVSSSWSSLFQSPSTFLPQNACEVTYNISLVYGYNVGMEISLADTRCGASRFACTIKSGCPVSGPSGSCYSPCCSSAPTCSDGFLPASGGGCKNNSGPGPHSPFYSNTCYNTYTYAFPDNDGAG